MQLFKQAIDASFKINIFKFNKFSFNPAIFSVRKGADFKTAINSFFTI
jgi:hypothetical protein